MGFSESFSSLLSLLTLISHVCIVLFVAGYFLKPLKSIHEKILAFIVKRGLWLGFAISMAAVVLSLVYSNYIGYPPCRLCWWQRIFLYPQAIIFGALFFMQKLKLDSRTAFVYSFILSLGGGLIAAFLYYGQTWNTSLLGTCDSSAVSCAKIYFTSFGYVTLPLMSLTAFAILAFISGISLMRAKVENRTLN